MVKFFHYLPIFGIHIHVHVYEDSAAVGRAFKRYAKKLDMDTEGNCDSRGMVFEDEKECRIYILFSKKDLTIELISHEVYHAVHAVYRLHNIKKKDETETAALLHEHFNKLIVRKLKTKKINIARS